MSGSLTGYQPNDMWGRLSPVTRAISQGVGSYCAGFSPALVLGWRGGLPASLPLAPLRRGSFCPPSLVLRRSTRYVTVTPQHTPQSRVLLHLPCQCVACIYPDLEPCLARGFSFGPAAPKSAERPLIPGVRGYRKGPQRSPAPAARGQSSAATSKRRRTGGFPLLGRWIVSQFEILPSQRPGGRQPLNSNTGSYEPFPPVM